MLSQLNPVEDVLEKKEYFRTGYVRLREYFMKGIILLIHISQMFCVPSRYGRNIS